MTDTKEVMFIGDDLVIDLNKVVAMQAGDNNAMLPTLFIWLEGVGTPITAAFEDEEEPKRMLKHYHNWLFSHDSVTRTILQTKAENSGHVVMERTPPTHDEPGDIHLAEECLKERPFP